MFVEMNVNCECCMLVVVGCTNDKNPTSSADDRKERCHCIRERVLCETATKKNVVGGISNVYC